MALKVVRGRGFVGTLALAGGLMLAPAIVWPTWAYRIEEPVVDPTDSALPDAGGPTRVLLQLFWAWGRFGLEVTPPFEGQPPEAFPVPVLGVVTRVVLVLAAVLGAVVWLWARGERARLVGLAGIVVGWGTAVQAISGRVTFMTLVASDSAKSRRPEPEIVTFGAGTAENAALVLLSFAVLVLLTRPVLGISAAAWRKGMAWAARARVHDDADDEPRRAPVAVIRDASPGEIGRSKDGTLPARTRTYSSESVDFSDGPPDDERFRPR